MKIKISVVSLILFFQLQFSPIFSQNNYVSGYIISNKNDTTKGFIQRIKSGSTKCYFKKEINDKEIEYSPQDIASYRFRDNGKFYISKNAPFQDGEKKVFLEYLIKGKASIYFTRENIDHYFIEIEDDKLMELSEYPEVVKDSVGVMWVKPLKYKGKLIYLLSDCPEIQKDIESLDLQATPLINLAKKYHKKVCNNENCIVYERKLEPVKVHSSIEIGIDFSQLYNQYLYTNTNFSPCIQIGYKMEFENFIFSEEQFSFRTGLILQQFNHFVMYRDGSGVNWIKNDTLSTSLQSIKFKIPASIIYTFPLQKVKPYVELGLMNSLILLTTKSTNPLRSSFPIYQFGLFGTIGIKYQINKYHVLNFGLNYEYNSDFEDVQSYKQLKNKNISFVIGYEI